MERVTSVRALPPYRLEIEFSDGRIRSRVGDDTPPAAEAKPLPRRSKGKADPDDQGNLF